MIKLLEHTRRPDISFYKKGIIRISARVGRMLSLSPGDAINIAVCDGEYLLYAGSHHDLNYRYEAQCYRSKRDGGETYCANSELLCRKLMNYVGIKTERVSYMAGDVIERNGVNYVPIIIRNPLWSQT